MKRKKLAKKVYEEYEKYVSFDEKTLREIYFSTKNEIIKYAIICIAIYRIKNIKPYKEQIEASYVLSQGKIAEVETGQGKSIIGLMTAIFQATKNQKVYCITANEYLADRDMMNNIDVISFFNLSCSCLMSNQENWLKREIYKSDIIYSTISELGFDYLRDKSIYQLDSRILETYDFIIVDEVDSILIDEANTSLILADNEIENDEKLYRQVKKFVNRLNREDFEIKYDDQVVLLTKSGYNKAEKFFKFREREEEEYRFIWHIIEMTLKSKYLLKKDIDYLVLNCQHICYTLRNTLLRPDWGF